MVGADSGKKYERKNRDIECQSDCRGKSDNIRKDFVG